MADLNCLLERLTQDTMKAARDGKWDQVIALYDRRISQGQVEEISPGTTQALVELDKWLITRVQEAQAAIQQNLLEIQDQRRKLDFLKRQWTGNPNAQARHLLTI